MKKNVLALFAIIVYNVIASAQTSWIQKLSMNDNGRYAAIGFAVDGKGYVGLGQVPDGSKVYDLWEYDPTLNSWTNKADYPGVGSYAATAFVINGKGYVGLGAKNSTTNANDLWEYSPGTNTWKRMADFPGMARYGASSFVIGDTAFVGTGSYGNPNDYLEDMWMYVLSTNSWSRIADFPGLNRLHATAFTIGSFGYLGTGLSNKTIVNNDFWRYNKANNNWTRIPNFSGTARMGSVSFVVNNKAYVGFGFDITRDYNDFFEYDPLKNSWSTQIITSNNIPTRRQGIAFSINKIGYLGTGYLATGLFPDLWSFDLNAVSEVISDTLLIRCYDGPSVSLKAKSEFIHYLWSPGGETTSTIQVTNAGWYKVKVTPSAGNEQTDSIEVKVSKPVVDLGIDRYVCNPDMVRLNAGSGYRNYLWMTNETDSVIIARKTGNYSVQVTDRFGCKASDEINLYFVDKPKFNSFSIDTLICGNKSVILNLSADKGNYTLERTDTREKFQDINAVIPVFGTYPFKFTATDQYGCSVDTTFKIGFHKIPTVVLSIDSVTCYHYNLMANYRGDAQSDVSRFTWVFAGDTIADGIGVDSDTIPLGTNQSKRDLSLRVVQDGCANADTIKNIKVIPNLSVQVVDSVVCQPFPAEFIAKNSEKVFSDWDFGDGIIRRLDDHQFWTYQKDGYYNVSLKVTTDRGCTNSIAMDSAVYVAPIPTAGFSLDPEICLDLANHEIFYLGTGDSQDTYNWDLSGFDPEEIIQNPGTTQGPFTFNLKNKPLAQIALGVLSKYGCKSDTTKITVKRIPDFSMYATNNNNCTPLEAGFEGIINDLYDQLFFIWDYGDGKTGTGGNTSHFYNKADNKYNITVTALSGITGCSDSLKRDSLIFAYPKPKAEFNIDNKVVYNDKPTVNFSNASSGATSYSWDFGDGLTSNETNPSHDYLVTGYRTVLLEVFNEFVCSDTISHQVLVAFDRIFPPNAFSPNAPNPVDREYRLSSDGLKQEGYHFVIISHWNDIVFETKNEIKGWDGRMKNGDFSPAGNYVWVLDFFDFLGRAHRQTGTVTLVY